MNQLQKVKHVVLVAHEITFNYFNDMKESNIIIDQSNAEQDLLVAHDIQAFLEK